MSVDIVLKDIEWDGVNKIRVPLDGGGTQDFSIGGGSANLQTKTKTYTPTTSQQTDQITPDAGYDGMSEVDVTINAVPTATVSDSGLETLYIPSQQRKWRARGYIDFGTGGYVSGTQYTPYSYYDYIASGTTVTPTESQQTIGGADTILQDAVTVDAIPSNYVGTGITRRDDDDIQGIEDDPYYTVYMPAGYYQNSAQHDAPLGTEGTPTATKGAVSNHSVSVTPSVTNVKGYIVGGTHSGTAVSVSASELVSGTKSITQNGNNIDVTDYASVNVSVPTGTPTLQTKSKTYTPTTSQQTDTITPDNGYDGLDEVDITVNAVPTGSVTMPSSISTSGGTTHYTTHQTLVITASATATPDVTTAGYISAGISGSTNLLVNTNIPTVDTATITPTTTDQTIPGNRYTLGTQTISGDANLVAGNIKSGTSIFGVTGTYTGGGGVGTLLATKSLGTISTSSTSATDTGQSLSVSGINSYDALIVETSVDTVVNGRHTCTVAVILFAATSDHNTKSGGTIATVKQNYKISSSGVTTQRAGTTAYGIYPYSITISNGTATIPMYQRYSSTSTGTINGNYTARVYGLNLFDLIGG